MAGAGPGANRAMRAGRHSDGGNSNGKAPWLENGKALYGSDAAEGRDQGEPSLETGVQLAERGARRAVMDIWGRLHGFTQLGVPKRGWGSVGRHHPILRVTETSLRCSGPSFDE